MKWDSATILWRRPLKKIKYLSRSDLAQPFLHSKYLVKQKSIGSWLRKNHLFKSVGWLGLSICLRNILQILFNFKGKELIVKKS